MDMVGHEAIRPDFGPSVRAALGEQIPIEGIVSLFKESPFPVVPPLGHMMREIGDDQSGKTGHEP